MVAQVSANADEVTNERYLRLFSRQIYQNLTWKALVFVAKSKQTVDGIQSWTVSPRRPKEHLILLLLSNDITRTTPTKPSHENSQDVSFGDVLILTGQETDGAWEPAPYFFWEGEGGPVEEEEIIHFSYKNHNFFWILTAILTVLKQKRQIRCCGKKLLLFFFKFFFFPRLFTDSKYIRWCSATSGDKKSSY